MSQMIECCKMPLLYNSLLFICGYPRICTIEIIRIQFSFQDKYIPYLSKWFNFKFIFTLNLSFIVACFVICFRHNSWTHRFWGSIIIFLFLCRALFIFSSPAASIPPFSQRMMFYLLCCDCRHLRGCFWLSSSTVSSVAGLAAVVGGAFHRRLFFNEEKY